MRDIQKEFESCKEFMRREGVKIAEDEKLKISAEGCSKTCYGICCPKQDGAFEISIQAWLLDDVWPEGVLRGVIVHELLHTVPKCLGHGKTFLQYAQKLKAASGGEYMILGGPSADLEEHPEKGIKYKWECPDCGVINYYAENDTRIKKMKELKAKGRYSYCRYCARKIDPDDIKEV